MGNLIHLAQWVDSSATTFAFVCVVHWRRLLFIVV
jgi:hypothetical protein